MRKLMLLIDGSSLLTTQYTGNLPIEILRAKSPEEAEKSYHKIMQTGDGIYTNGVYGFLRTLFDIIRDQHPDYLAVAWDETRDTLRRKIYPEYKANRTQTAVPLAQQFSTCREVLDTLGICQISGREFEADDYCGSMAKTFASDDVDIRILTKDQDYLQLADDSTAIWMIVSPERQAELERIHNLSSAGLPKRVVCFTPDLVRAEYGFDPVSVPAWKGLAGDASDNIKGVASIGDKSARPLAAEYQSIEALYNAIDEAQKGGKAAVDALKEHWKTDLGIARSPYNALIKDEDPNFRKMLDEKVQAKTASADEKAISSREAAFLGEELATIERSIAIPFSLEDLRVSLSLESWIQVRNRYEFNSLKFPEVSADNASAADSSDLPAKKDAFFNEADVLTFTDYTQAEDFIRKLSGSASVSIVLAEDKFTPLAMAVANEEHIAFLPVGELFSFADLTAFAKTLASSCTAVYVPDAKQFYHCTQIPELPGLRDVKLAAYLLEPQRSNYSVSAISSLYLGVNFAGYEELYPKTSVADAAAQITFPAFLAQNAKAVFSLLPILEKKLAEEGMKDLYETIELPTARVLCSMETDGIRVDKDILRQSAGEMDQLSERLALEIYYLAKQGIDLAEAGTPMQPQEGKCSLDADLLTEDHLFRFNILSPKQLAELLFEKMELPYPGRKSKKSYSTAADILEQLAPKYPIVEKVLEYRKLTKLKSTYIDGLTDCIAEDGRVHGTFNQTIANTGRLSSTNPNLQNIPVRSEAGREIRKAFVPQEGWCFVDGDYSQIELRLLAHMSGDQNLIHAYNQDADIHRATAAAVFHVPLSEVTPQQRSNAKAVNFGIVYGISAYGLGEDLSISAREAKEYIDEYFRSYPRIKEFIDGLVSGAKENGYTTTVYGRRRYIPELKSETATFMQKKYGERQAMNAPIQGTAADIMKIAMIRVARRLQKDNLRSRIILQVHDELLLETPAEEKEQVIELLREEMSNAASLSVPLEISIATGENWYEAK